MEKAPFDLSRNQFGENFHWGVSTAAFQIEGSCDADGKGLSIWDDFTSRKGRIKNNDHARVACDFYNGFKSDVPLIKELNIPNFRFSISWSRIMPHGVHYVNRKGIDYYNSLINSLLENGIEPWVTLYHWDLPHELELKGGWTNRDVVSWFSDFTRICVKYFGDRVKNWIVINEPSVFTGAGYFLGIHAPGKRGLENYLKAIHFATLSTVAGAKVLRDMSHGASIGTTFSMTHIEPFSNSQKDVAAAKRVDTLLNRTFLEPILGLGYPAKDLPILNRIEKYMIPEDEKNLSFDFDFTGLQCYTREIVKASYFTPYIGAALVEAAKRSVQTTNMGWEVFPESIYHLLKKLDAYEGIKKIVITENGVAFSDKLLNGNVVDSDRTKFLQDHLLQVWKAKNEGCMVEGYFVWSLLDNFEWAEGFHPRFGLIYVDYETQQRIIKQSGLWYKKFLS